MRIFIDYIKENIRILCWIVVSAFILFLSLWAEGAAASDSWYTVSLELAVWGCACAAGFIRYWKKRKILTRAEKSLGYDLSSLPETSSPLEKVYQEFLSELQAQKQDQEYKALLQRKDQLDYYSLWVHQIKTPIAGMRLLLQAQRDGLLALAASGKEAPEADTEEAVDWNSRMGLELTRVEQYVGLVLSYLRMEDMGKDLVLRKCSLDALVKKTAKRFAREFCCRKISLEVKPFTLTVLTDEKWLELVLEQVLMNALKYTSKDGHVRIYLEKEKLVIEDDGIGIRSEDLPRVFEKGFTGYNGREEKRSTGIGLYLCKCIMDKLNHNLTIQSEAGIGTKVIFDLTRETLWTE